jgi:hypothetical protein
MDSSFSKQGLLEERPQCVRISLPPLAHHSVGWSGSRQNVSQADPLFVRRGACGDLFGAMRTLAREFSWRCRRFYRKE